MDLKSIDLQGWLDWFAKNKDAFEAIDVILGIFVILLILPIYWGIKRFLKWMRSPAPMPNPDSGVHDAPPNNREVRVGGDNPGIINAGEGTVITAGDNATIVVGYTIEKHDAILNAAEERSQNIVWSSARMAYLRGELPKGKYGGRTRWITTSAPTVRMRRLSISRPMPACAG